MPICNLAGLPIELLRFIACCLDLEDPQGLAALSQTCRRAYSACAELVTARRDMDRQYRVIHDRHPLNVPILLKLASDDALREAWHVRRAEFWCNRDSYDSWCVLSDFACPTWPGGNEDPRDELWYALLCGLDKDDAAWEMTEQAGGTSFDEVLDRHVEEARALREEGFYHLLRDAPIYRTILEKMYGAKDGTIVGREIERLEQGRDEICKALLLPLCKNLDTLVFLESAEPSEEHPLYLLNLLIRQCYLNKASKWPPGFLSLRKVSINSETDARNKPVFPKIHQVTMEIYDVVDIEPLFALPNLKVLRLGRLHRRSDHSISGRRLPRTSITPGTSSVEALEISKCELDIEDTHYLFSLPRRLRYLQSDDIYTPIHLRTLHNCPDSVPNALEKLSFRSTMGLRLWVLANYTFLKQVEGITADCLVWHSSDKAEPVPAPTGPQECFEFPTRGENHEVEARLVTLEALELTLPPNVETLSIHFLMEGQGLGFFNAFIRELLRNVSGQAEDEAHTGADFAQLREVTFLLQNGNLPEDFEWDEETLAGLKAKDIHVSHKQIHSTTELPEFEDVEESKWEHCFEDRHYTDPRHDVEGYEGRKFGIVRSYMDYS